MRENVEKLLNYIQRHLAGTGIAAVITVMTVAVVLGVSGQRFGFDPGDISESYSAGYSESPDARDMICPKMEQKVRMSIRIPTVKRRMTGILSWRKKSLCRTAEMKG